MAVSRPERVLRQHLTTDQLLGVDAVPLGPPPESEASPAPPVDEPNESSAPPTAAVPPPRTRYLEGPPLPEFPPKGPPGNRRVLLEQMDREEVQGCTRCELHRGRTQTVFGEGDANASLMIVGEGPGAEEDRTGRPFVGRAGELLTKQIGAMGLTREQVYIANVVKCRPPQNRTPTPAEAETCGNYLRQQIEVIRPRVILTVGGPAAKLLLGSTEGITRLRGTWHTYDQVQPEIPVMPTFHPAYLLRSYTKENRQKVWSDLQQVMQRLGMGQS
jgi:DNA polymerase